MLRWLIVIGLVVACGSAVEAPSPTASALAAGSPSPSRTQTIARTATPDPATLRQCTSTELQAVIAWAPVPDGSLVGAVFIANRGAQPCRLRGHPEVSLRGDRGGAAEVRVALVSPLGAGPPPVVVPVTQFRQDPAGLDGIGARAPLEWENYCARERILAFTLALPESGGHLEGTFVEPSGVPMRESLVPRCEDGAGTSTLAIHPLREPAR